jgi:hypothetical protein
MPLHPMLAVPVRLAVPDEEERRHGRTVPARARANRRLSSMPIVHAAALRVHVLATVAGTLAR